MTISSTVSQVLLPANGVATQFSFPNKIFQAADLTVTIIDNNGNQYPFTLSGVNTYTNLTLGVSYTVFNIDVDIGCFVTFTAAVTNGWSVDMRTVIGEVQSTSIKNQGSFNPELHEEFFDKITREVQDLRRLTYTFGIHGPDIETTVWPALPLPAARKGLSLVFDPISGLPTCAVPIAQTLTQGLFNSYLVGSPPYVQTDAEIAASVAPTNYNYTQGDVRRYGADPSGVADSTAAINNAISVMYKAASAGTTGGALAVVNFPPGTFKVSSTINAKSYVKMVGVYGEDATFGVQTPQLGTELNWVGAGAGPILKVFDVRLFELDGFVIQGNGGASIVGILLDSDNNPSGSQNEFHRFSIRNCFLGVQWGTSGLTNAYANDSTRFVNGTIWSSVAGSNGITINSGNAADQSVIDGIGIEVQNIGIYVLVASILKITRCFGGNNLTGGFIAVSTAIGLTISECSSEGWGGNPAQFRSSNSAFMVINAPQGGFAVNNFTITMIQNQINNPITVNYAVRILSMGDNWGQCTGLVNLTFTVPPTGTSGTLTGNWTFPSSTYTVYFSDGEIRTVTLTNGATTATWSGALTGTPTVTAVVTSITVNAQGSFTTGISSLVQINNGVNPGSVDISTGPFSATPVQGWLDSAFVDIARLDPWLGAFQPSFLAGSYTGNGAMTWTVAGGNVTYVAYTLQNRIMTIFFNIGGSTVGGTVNTDLLLLIPAGKVATNAVTNSCVIVNNGVQAGGIVLVVAADTHIRFRLLAGGNWTASANTGMQGQISFPVN